MWMTREDLFEQLTLERMGHVVIWGETSRAKSQGKGTGAEVCLVHLRGSMCAGAEGARGEW